VRKEIVTVKKKLSMNLVRWDKCYFFASPDGRVVAGGVAGLLVAASTIQVLLLTIRKNFTSQKSICVVLFG
jgi:hypothetical protein